MSGTLHVTTIEPCELWNRYDAYCSCGWRKTRTRKDTAMKAAGDHAAALNGVCRKKKFPNKEAAQQALADAVVKRLRHNERRQERRAYFCDQCKAWHLTSTPSADFGRVSGGPA